MSTLMQFPEVFSIRQDEGHTPSLETLNSKSLDRLQHLTVPTRKTENWRYSARHIQLNDTLSKQLPKADKTEVNFTRMSEWCVVFVNGHFCAEQSSLPTDDSIAVSLFSETSTLSDELIETLNSASSESLHPFSVVNGTHLCDGVQITLAKNVQITKPVQIVFATTGEPGASHARLLINAEPGSQSTFIEEYVNLATESDTPEQFNTAVTQIALAENAQIDLIRLSLEPETIQHVGLTKVSQKRDSRFHHHYAAFGGKLKRHDMEVLLNEPGAFCRLNGVYLTRNDQHVDNHTRIEHIAENCESEETYRGIADGDSHAIFNGQILIHRDAQKSIGNMSNKNLLLSSNAEIDTKPELEIYADDVKCSHGATIGQLDKESLFYLVSRGISPDVAASMLSMGFINELLAQFPVEIARSMLEERLQNFLKQSFIDKATN